MYPETDFPTDLRALESSYELIRELGQRGVAAVFLARHRESGRLVAIKAIQARYLDDADALQRFAREARTVVGLDHPNIVRTEAIEQFGDRAIAIIMEYIAGGTVRDRLREYGAFSAEHAENVLRDVATALGYAHRHGIVHRDVRPENVFLEKATGRALLADFGIARRIEEDAPITLLGAALGTPQYMSPEQIDGSEIDGRSDIYSLGVLGWELLTGKRPWAGQNLYGIIYKQKHEDLPRIKSLRPRVPANLLFAVEGALAKDRTQRWQTIDEFLEELTYDPPPVLAQTVDSGPGPVDDSPTVRFRRPGVSTPDPNDYSAPWVSGAGDGFDEPRVAWVPETAPRLEPIPRRARGRWARRLGVALVALLVPLAIADVPWVPGPGRPSVTMSAGNVSLAGARAPSRCAVPSMADQRACLLELVALNDAPLQRVYDSLIVETRRLAKTPTGGVDPPSVARLQAEQQRWAAERERNCTRDPAPGFVTRWAQPISTCFARMSAARRDELMSRLERARRGPQ
ncbi:MAG TPA: protein kinase [Gemmatimonadaceae bacterium]|nr:protein kinase [Gemmatimonadaceae bacterium]